MRIKIEKFSLVYYLIFCVYRGIYQEKIVKGRPKNSLLLNGYRLITIG